MYHCSRLLVPLEEWESFLIEAGHEDRPNDAWIDSSSRYPALLGGSGGKLARMTGSFDLLISWRPGFRSGSVSPSMCASRSIEFGEENIYLYLRSFPKLYLFIYFWLSFYFLFFIFISNLQLHEQDYGY